MGSYYLLLSNNCIEKWQKFNTLNFEKTSTIGTFVRCDGAKHRDEQYVESVCVALHRLIFTDSSIMSAERLNLDIYSMSMEPKEEKQIRYIVRENAKEPRRSKRLRKEQQYTPTIFTE